MLQYAIYDDRGLWLSKKLRSLWNAGCDVQIIYSLATRPVLAILRNSSGRGGIPMRQSVIKNGAGEIVKYNHSKWMTITGRWGGSSAAYVTFTGSANWADPAFGDDEPLTLTHTGRSKCGEHLARRYFVESERLSLLQQFLLAP